LTNQFNVEKIFIGSSPSHITSFYGGCYGNDGNSILLKLANNEYIYINDVIYRFTSKSPIIEYHSPINKNNDNFPYAIDDQQRYYLLVEKRILIFEEEMNDFDPYDYYYSTKK
jgi:hypothetical protein